MDIFPTICEITGSKLPDCAIDGYSLLPIIESESTLSKHRALYFQWEDQWAVREGQWKLIVKGRDTTGKFSTHAQKEEEMESPYLANLEAADPRGLQFRERTTRGRGKAYEPLPGMGCQGKKVSR